MITAAQCAEISSQVYQDKILWDHQWEVEGVVCAHRKIDSDNVLVFRGSVTAEDWLDDFDTVPVCDHEIGFCHQGFLGGMDEILAAIASSNLIGPLILTGHSLGAARARIAAAKLLIRKQAVSSVTVFGSPKPGFANTRRIFEKSGIQHTSYRNREDPVPLVPFTLLPLLPWEHTEPWTKVDSAPSIDNLDPLRDHSIALYVAALS